METLNEQVQMVKPIILFNRPIFITCYFRKVENPKYENYGLWHGHTTSHYDPFWEVFQKDELYLPIEDCIKKAESLGFIKVKYGFSTYSINDLKEIKEQLSQEWIDLYNKIQPDQNE